MELEELRMLQALPLDVKIMKSKLRIEEWYRYWDGKVYVSFSGGKDSTVLLHLVRSLYPDIEAVFSNTGLEYPEITEFVESVNNVTHVRPKMSFKQVIEQEGYPIISKKVARMIHDLQNPNDKNEATRVLYRTGVKRDGTITKSFKLAEQWIPLINAPFKVSHKCCDIMKKRPLHEYEKETKKHPFIGTMADDGQSRESSYLKTGCNVFREGGKSAPLGFWTEKDIWDYIKLFNIPYSKIYDMGEKRTGCIWCIFGIMEEMKHCKENRFQRMQKTHPQLYKYCMNNLGIKEVLNFINVPYESQITIDDLLKKSS